jgi:hypothetical protein
MNYQIEDWVRVAQRTKWRWMGKMGSVTDNRWSVQALFWDPATWSNSNIWRKHGRPYKRWNADINSFWMDTYGLQRDDWKVMAANFHDWSSHENEFVEYLSKML